MTEVLTSLAIVAFLASVSEALVEFFVVPAWSKVKLDTFWLMYVGAAVAAGLVFLSGQNLLAGYLPPQLEIVGRVLTALLAGRGSNWVHDFFSAQRKTAVLASQRASILQMFEAGAGEEEADATVGGC